VAVITSTDLKTYLGIGDAVDDATIDWAVDATNSAVVQTCYRSFDKTAEVDASERKFQAFDPGFVWVDDFWSTTGLVVATDDDDNGTFETTWTIDTDFTLEPVNGLRNGETWPYMEVVAVGTRRFPTAGLRRGVSVTAAWGWDAVPTPVFNAALINAARLFKRRKSPEGVLAGFADFGPVRISRIDDPDAARLLEPYLHPTAKLAV